MDGCMCIISITSLRDIHDDFYYGNAININMFIPVAVDVCMICYIILICFMASNSDWVLKFWDVGRLPLVRFILE